MTTAIATIFVFGIIVFIHELGHFLTAKSVGMRVEEFALGFGRKIVGVQKGETLYSLRMIPLGGFNKISGMDPEEAQDERAYSAKPIWARMIVIVAGSIMNFLLGIFLFFVVLMSSGINEPSNEPILGELIDNKPAVMAGLAEGDRVIAINGEKVRDWHGIVDTVKAAEQPDVMVTYIRDGVKHETMVTAEWEPVTERYLIGVLPKIEHRYLGIDEAFVKAVEQTGDIIQRIIVGIKQMVTGEVRAELAGPLGVVQMTGEVASLGIIPLLNFTAFLSINLGILNLLPIPGLDGGHVVTLLVEAVRGKAINSKVLQAVQLVGIVLLIGLMIFATISDFSRFNF